MSLEYSESEKLSRVRFSVSVSMVDVRMRSLKLAVVGGFLISSLLTGCTGMLSPDPDESGSGSPSKPTFVFYPDGSASQNLDVFQNVLENSGAGTSQFDLNKAITALVDTGFSIDSITHTPLLTNIGEPADSVSLAIAFKGECLIGQFSKDWLTATIAQPTASGCLIGDIEQAILD
jgi:hypothetical protein